MAPPIPIRDLGAVGVVKDREPYDLPVNAVSRAMNVQFSNGRVERTPSFFTLEDTLTPTYPVYSISGTPENDFDFIVYAGKDGTLYHYANGSETNVTYGSHTPADYSAAHTGCFLGNILYINRPDTVPYWWDMVAATFDVMSAWDAGWRCNALRSFKDFLIAINVTKGAVNYPTMVKWSDIALAGVEVSDWDETSTTNSAGENNLTEIATALVDGGTLGTNFILYAEKEVWMMEYVGGNDIFAFRPLFKDVGIINQNCFAEADRKHFVFGPNDIYVHDGIEKVSIADDRVREYFLKYLNVSKKERFFVHYDYLSKTVWFCASSGHPDCTFTDTTYCNLAAVYRVKDKTWSFADLPNVSSAARLNANLLLTWDAVAESVTYDNFGGSYLDQDDSGKRYTTWLSVADATNGLTANKIHLFDYIDKGSVSLSLDSEAFCAAFVERDKLDLTALGVAMRDYKNARCLVPRLTTYQPDVEVVFNIGCSDTPKEATVWGDDFTFNADDDYKVDTLKAGRYLSYRMTVSTTNDFSFSGFDLDMVVTSHR